MAPARSVDVLFKNDTDFNLTGISLQIDAGIWTVEPPLKIAANSSASFSTESDGLFTGTEGNVVCKLDNYTTTVSLAWDNPYGPGHTYAGDVSDPTFVRVISTQDGSGDNASMTWVLQETSSQRDGIPDDWKLNGVEMDDGTGNKAHVDLPAMGASVHMPDIFVHLDFMGDTTHNHKLSSAAIRKVINAFRNAPHISPTGALGINLHVDAGPDSILNFDTGATWGTLSRIHQIPEVPQYGTTTDGLYDWSTLDAEKKFPGGYTSSGRTGIFHYCASVHSLGIGGEGGLARGIGGTDFILALGALGFPTLSDMLMAGVFMHELGHNLGLGHGGSDSVLNKPNYVSVMNYLFTANGLSKNGTTLICDYSGLALPTLDENNLDETKGLGPQAAGLGTFRWSPRASTTSGKTGAFVAIPDASQPIDWDDDGSPTNTAASFDINGDDPVSGSFTNLTTLTSYNDWAILKLKGGDIGGKLDAGQVLMQSPINEFTRDDFDKIQPLDTTPPVTTSILNPPANAAGWNNTAVQVTFDSTDDISGVINTFYAEDDDVNFTKLPPGSSITISGEGTHTVRYYSQDRAQNQESIKTITINIDLTPPEAVISYDPHKHSIIVTGTDSLSGTYAGGIAPMSVTPSIWRIGAADIAETRVYRILDYAGNYLDLSLQIRNQENEYEINVTKIDYSNDMLSRSSKELELLPNTIQFRRLLPGNCCSPTGTTHKSRSCCCEKNSSNCLLGVLQRLTVALSSPVGHNTIGAFVQANWDILHNESNIQLMSDDFDTLTSSTCEENTCQDASSKDEKGVHRYTRVCGFWKMKLKTELGRLTMDTAFLAASVDGKANVAEMKKVASGLF